MKIKKGYIVKQTAGTNIIVPLGKADFNRIMSLSESGKLLFDTLSSGAEQNDLVNIILDEYEIDRDTAEKDVGEFVESLRNAGLLDE